MKKFAKMSLVAAVAVAGMTTANAKDLSEAIKGVDVSGTVVYRYNDYGDGDASSTTTNNYKIGMNLSSPVNEDVKANTRFLVASDAGSFGSLKTDSEGDQNFNVTLSHVNFAYSGIKNTTVIVGKQGLATPWTNAIDSDGSEQTGTGILGLTTWGPVTAAAGYFNQTNMDTLKVEAGYNPTDKTGTSITVGDNGSEDLVVAALMAKVGPVSGEAWYLDIDDFSNAYFVKASAKFNVSDVALTVFAQYQDHEYEADKDLELSLFKTGVSAKMGVFNAGVNYGTTGDDGTGVVNSLSKAGMIGWNTSLDDHYDADMIQVDLGMQVTPELHVGLNYDAIDTTDAVDHDETDVFTQITYKMSKNLMTYVRFGSYEIDNTDTDGERGRLQVQYSF